MSLHDAFARASHLFCSPYAVPFPTGAAVVGWPHPLELVVGGVKSPSTHAPLPLAVVAECTLHFENRDNVCELLFVQARYLATELCMTLASGAFCSVTDLRRPEREPGQLCIDQNT